MTNLGWANGWTETPEAVKVCNALYHRKNDIDVGEHFRGLEHVVTCPICQIEYRYDSSDQ